MISGQQLLDMFSTGTAFLEKSAADIDAINVFPVPDGDTGTNMLLTMRSAMDEASRSADGKASSVIKSMADGALMGARGNSGVILSQILRGLAKGLAGKDSFNARDFCLGMEEASDTAYRGLSRPVEGTMLTVIRETAEMGKIATQKEPDDLKEVLEILVKAAAESVARTPLLLPALKEAGVVDAGGQGLYVIFQGMLQFFNQETAGGFSYSPELAIPAMPLIEKLIPTQIELEDPYGYCTEFLIEGNDLKPDKIRMKLEKKGKSLIVIGDSKNVRVHIHSFDPGAVLHYASLLGVLHGTKIDNMDDQHRQFVEMQRSKIPTLALAVVAVVAGEGLKSVFRSLGAQAVVTGGQTMNPSVRELYQAVESVPSDNVIILPNNKNIILTASQVESLSKKKIIVIPTRTIPQGIASLLSFKFESDMEENSRLMEQSLKQVTSLEITQAIRTTQVKGLPVKKGQVVAIVNDDEIVAVGDVIFGVIFQALSKLNIENMEIITIYFGAQTKSEDANKLLEELNNRYAGKQVEVVDGGQPHYSYIISLE